MYKDEHDVAMAFPLSKRSRPRRRSFGIVHYATGGKASFLVIPSSVGIYPGDKITFYKEEGGISFRVEKDGVYSIYGGGTTTKTMRSGLCDELRDFASHKIRDIAVRTVEGGWFVPFDQFD